MKAKYGKASLGCCFAFWGYLIFWAFTTNDGELKFASLKILLFSVCGIIFAMIGAVKKEKPKEYFLFGLILNIHLLGSRFLSYLFSN